MRRGSVHVRDSLPGAAQASWSSVPGTGLLKTPHLWLRPLGCPHLPEPRWPPHPPAQPHLSQHQWCHAGHGAAAPGCQGRRATPANTPLDSSGRTCASGTSWTPAWAESQEPQERDAGFQTRACGRARGGEKTPRGSCLERHRLWQGGGRTRWSQGPARSGVTLGAFRAAVCPLSLLGVESARESQEPDGD